MKKNGAFIFVIIILLVISAVSIGQNVKNAADRDSFRRHLLNYSFGGAIDISRGLDPLIINLENNAEVSEETRNSLITVSNDFVKLDTLLKQYAIYFPPRGTYRSSYTSMSDFGFIAKTLIAVNVSQTMEVPFYGILTDDVISENEIRYLKTLRDDINIIIAAMASPDDALQVNPNLTIDQMDRIMDSFFSKWSFTNEEAPFLLLS